MQRREGGRVVAVWTSTPSGSGSHANARRECGSTSLAKIRPRFSTNAATHEVPKLSSRVILGWPSNYGIPPSGRCWLPIVAGPAEPLTRELGGKNIALKTGARWPPGAARERSPYRQKAGRTGGGSCSQGHGRGLNLVDQLSVAIGATKGPTTPTNWSSPLMFSDLSVVLESYLSQATSAPDAERAGAVCTRQCDTSRRIPMRDSAFILSSIPVAVRTKWVAAPARQARTFVFLRQRAAIETWQRPHVDGLACGPWLMGIACGMSVDRAAGADALERLELDSPSSLLAGRMATDAQW